MHIGLYPIAAKPYHIGHHMVMQKASKECDKAILIISLLDRENVSGTDMAIIWRDHIIPTLPENVSTIFLESSPVSHVFHILKLRNDDPLSEYSFTIYGDENDIKKYEYDKLSSVCPRLLESGGINIAGIPRNKTVNISGTKMRSFISQNDFESFKKFIPEEINAQKIFEILTAFHK